MNPAQAILHTCSPEETLALGQQLGRSLEGGLTIGLSGSLGAGKTQLVKGIATGNGLANPRQVTSPTFTLIHEYSGKLTIYHIDVYRLRGPAELIALGLEELVRPDSAVLIEWADRVRGILPLPLLAIDIESMGPTTRQFTLSAAGEAALECLRSLQQRWD